MNWPKPPYPPGFEPLGTEGILLIGGIIFCLLGVAIYLTVKEAMAQCGPLSSQQPPDQPPP